MAASNLCGLRLLTVAVVILIVLFAGSKLPQWQLSTEFEGRALAAEARAARAEARVLELEARHAGKRETKDHGKREAVDATTSDSSASSWTTLPPPSHPRAVDCNAVARKPPLRAAWMKSIGPDYMVSYSWWDSRGGLTDAKGKMKSLGDMMIAESNDSVEEVQKLVLASPPGAALLDIGANVGFMTFFAPATGRSVYAFDPISYDIAKLCEGLLLNLASNTLSLDQIKQVHLFHAAVGAKAKSNIQITRPADNIGFFDQASLTAAAVEQPGQKVTETIDMVAVDDIVPDEVPVGVVKIDVQGHEAGVLRGMTRLLSRNKGYPTAVLFEEVPDLTRKAGWTPGECKKMLEGFGYACKEQGIDVLCQKDA